MSSPQTEDKGTKSPHLDQLRKSAPKAFVDTNVKERTLKINGVEMEYVASAPHYDPRRVTDYYMPVGDPRSVEARVYNPDTGTFERRVVGTKLFTSKTRLR